MYQFLDKSFKRESKVVLVASLILALGLLGLNVWNEFFNRSDTQIYQLIGFSYGLLANFWALILCIRKSLYLRHRDKEAATAFLVLIAVNVGFVTTSVVAVIFGFYSTIGYWTFFITVWSGNLVQIVVYINYAAVPTSFQVKVSAFSFVTVVTFLTVVTLVFFPPVLPNDLISRFAQQDGLAKMIAIILGATLFVVLVLPRILRQTLTMPLQRLLTGVQEVNAGNLSTFVVVGMPDEIGVLTENFNHMTQSLRYAKEELVTYAQTLEQKVTERTAELNNKSTALEQSIAHLKATQTQLIQVEKMASLGELTAGIAHEIQNPLNFVNNFSELSSDLVTDLKEGPIKALPDSEQEYANGLMKSLTLNLQKITHHGQRADAIVKSMLEHSRAGTGERGLANINTLANEYLRLSYHGFQAKDKEFNAKLITSFDPELGQIEMVAQDISRVLLNILNNAFYSVHEKAQKTANGYQPEIKIATESKNGLAELRIWDNGTGIAPEILGKIFQPFFSTKPSGQGTGLGLSLSFDIVTKGHGGQMQVESEVGEFTEMIVRLPMKNRLSSNEID